MMKNAAGERAGLGMRWVVTLAMGLLTAGCNTLENVAFSAAWATAAWSFFLLSLPLFVIGAGPALIFHQLDDMRSGVIGAEFSPVGNEILVTYREEKQQHLYRVGPDSAYLWPLTSGERFDFDACWSPDGEQIAFVSSNPKRRQADLYLMNADGTGQTPLTDDDVLELSPQFSPDGSRIVFCRWHLGEQGKKFVRAELVEVDVITGAVTILTEGPHFDFSPTYTNDGTGVLFVRATDMGKTKEAGDMYVGEYHLNLLNLTTGELRELTEASAREITSFAVARGSAQSLIYGVEEAYESMSLKALAWSETEVTISPLDGGYPDMIGRDGDLREKREPVLSPDGQSLLYVMNASKKPEWDHFSYAPFELHEVDRVSGRVRQLTDFGKVVTEPRYASDGEKILFLLNERPGRDRKRHSLWLVERNSGKVRKLPIGEWVDEAREKL